MDRRETIPLPDRKERGSLAAPSCSLLGFHAGETPALRLFATAGAGVRADGVGLRLENNAVKRSRRDKASAEDAYPAQRESSVGTTLPGTAAV